MVAETLKQHSRDEPRKGVNMPTQLWLQNSLKINMQRWMFGPIVKTCIAYWNKSSWHIMRTTDHHHFNPLPSFFTSSSKGSCFLSALAIQKSLL